MSQRRLPHALVSSILIVALIVMLAVGWRIRRCLPAGDEQSHEAT